jgi:hypothetical protein
MKIKTITLKADGDFRSPECVEFLKEADVIVTNPPFSLFREHITQLIQYDKKFLVIGNMNAITYKEVFPLIKDNKIWLGVNNGAKTYNKPDGTTQKLGNTCWFTNLEHYKRNKEMILYKKYNEEKYPKYDNYDVINVDKVKNIPMDFQSFMGVPITFLEKINPKQFEILGIANNVRWIGYECITIINGRKVYNRLIIKRK